jgi:hypothetical protein
LKIKEFSKIISKGTNEASIFCNCDHRYFHTYFLNIIIDILALKIDASHVDPHIQFLLIENCMILHNGFIYVLSLFFSFKYFEKIIEASIIFRQIFSFEKLLNIKKKY